MRYLTAVHERCIAVAILNDFGPIAWGPPLRDAPRGGGPAPGTALSEPSRQRRL